jgi:hypothetical protein
MNVKLLNVKSRCFNCEIDGKIFELAMCIIMSQTEDFRGYFQGARYVVVTV